MPIAKLFGPSDSQQDSVEFEIKDRRKEVMWLVEIHMFMSYSSWIRMV